MKIVAMDMGKSKTVVCYFDSVKGSHRYETIPTLPQKVHDAVVGGEAGRVVVEIGPRLSEAMSAAIDDASRFENGKQVGSYFGLTPRRYQSGSTNRQGKISGCGNKLVRSMLIQVSWLGLRYSAWMRGIYERARRGSKSRKKIAIVAVARKLAVLCWVLLKEDRFWQERKAA